MEVERLSDDKHTEQEQGASVSGNGAQLKEKGMKEAQSQGIKGPALPPGWAQEATIADDEEESNKKGNKVSQVRNHGGACLNWGSQIHPKFPSCNKKGNKVSQVWNVESASLNWGLCQIHPKFSSSPGYSYPGLPDTLNILYNHFVK